MGRFSRFLALFFPVALASLPVVSAADWSMLERYQHTMTRAEFDGLVREVYCPSLALTNYLLYTTNSVEVFSNPSRTNTPLFVLQFGTNTPSLHHSIPPSSRVVLDPGHIGGAWARMEERWFVLGKEDPPVQEAALNLMVARLLKPPLEADGTTAFLTKDSFQPVTDKRPEDFLAEAQREVMARVPFAGLPSLEREADIADAVRKRAEQLFYRTAEITARARRINEEFKPDLTICIHFNAVDWNDCHDLVDDNRLVVFVHGNYLPAELEDDDQKLRLFAKLLGRSHERELAVAEGIATALAAATGLPAVNYGPGSGAVRIGVSPYVYARNLAANRLYDGPVVYLEPYYMNNRTVYRRLQLGDYDGTKEVDGKPYKSIFREYADAVARGVIQAPSRLTAAP